MWNAEAASEGCTRVLYKSATFKHRTQGSEMGPDNRRNRHDWTVRLQPLPEP